MTNAFGSLQHDDLKPLLRELGLSPLNPLGHVTLCRVDDRTADMVLSHTAPDREPEVIRGIATLGRVWPANLGRFVIDWFGLVDIRLRRDNENYWFPCIVLGDLVIQGWNRTVWEVGARVRVQMRWHPQRGDALPATQWHPDSTPAERRRAELGIQLLLDNRQLTGRTGRPPGRTEWPKARFLRELFAFCLSFNARHGRPPTQEEAARALGDMPITSFQNRFDRYVRQPTGQNWATYSVLPWVE